MSAIKYEEELKRVFIAHEKSTSVFLDHTNWLWVGLYSILFLLDLFFFKVLDATITNMILLGSYVLLFAAVHIWVKSKDFTGRWVKYVLMSPILISTMGMTIFSEAMFDVAYVALLMISSAYYDRKVVVSISVIGIFSYALAKCLYLIIDFDHLATEYEESFSEDTLWVSFPFFLLYVIFSVFSVLKAMSGKKEIENYVREYCENISMNNELSVAQSIQHGMLQPEAYITEDFEIYASMSSAKAVGGDFYDYYRKDERYVFFNIADVSGKGLPAAMFAVNTSSYMRASSKADVNIYEVCNTTNKSLCERNPEKMFVTTFMGFLNLETGMVDYINAGHNPAFIIKADG
ncbi:MAG: SpoIIE family protein phosphatase, partial [Paludibacteraceae bacterium]|nr:SpoIIE family protein phosphatase [Paludibacteraceae bacterium]